MPKRKSSTSSPARTVRQKRLTSVVTDDELELEEPHAEKSEGSAGNLRESVAKQESRPHRYLGCKVPKNVAYAGGSVIQEVMQDLERMGLKSLVSRPWQLKSKFACQEYVDFVYVQRTFPADHRVHHVKFDKDALASLYDLPPTGILIRPRLAVSRHLFSCWEAFPSKFFTASMPRRGWTYNHVRDSRLRKIFMVLNPIFHPIEYDLIKRTTALVVCMAWLGEEINWAGFLSARLYHLVKNFASPRKCYLSPFLLHSYEKAGSLTDTEQLHLEKKESTMREEAKKAHEQLEILRKQKPVTRAQAKAAGHKTTTQLRPCGAHDFLDLSRKSSHDSMGTVGSGEGSVGAKCTCADDSGDDTISKTEEPVKVNRGGGDGHQVDVSQGANACMQPRSKQGRGVRSVHDARRASLRDEPKCSEVLRSTELHEELDTDKDFPGSSAKQSQPNFPPGLGSVSGGLKLLLPTIRKLEDLVDGVADKLGCSSDDILSGIDVIKEDVTKFYDDLQKTKGKLKISQEHSKFLREQSKTQLSRLHTQKEEVESELEICLREFGILKLRFRDVNFALEDKKKALAEKETTNTTISNMNVSLAASVADLECQLGAMRKKLEEQELQEKAEKSFANRVTQGLERDLLQSRRAKDDALSEMNRVHALNVSHIISALGRFQKLLRNFENPVPRGLENLVKQKLKDHWTADQNLVLRIVVNEIASASDVFNSTLHEARKQLEKLFVLAKDMREALSSPSSTLSGGHELGNETGETATGPPTNDLAVARDISLQAAKQVQAEKYKATCDKYLEFQSSPRGNGVVSVIQQATGSGSGFRAAGLAVKAEAERSTDGWGVGSLRFRRK